MKNLNGHRRTRGFIVICFGLLALAGLPLMSAARTVATSVNVVNNSSREIRAIYLSSVNADDWSSNQIESSTIPAGGSYALNNIACNQQQVKVIAEDQDGCFLSTVVSCGDNGTWTITSDTARDCGQ